MFEIDKFLIEAETAINSCVLDSGFLNSSHQHTGESRYAQQRLWNSHFLPSTFVQACGEHLGWGIASHAPSDKTLPRKRVFPLRSWTKATYGFDYWLSRIFIPKTLVQEKEHSNTHQCLMPSTVQSRLLRSYMFLLHIWAVFSELYCYKNTISQSHVSKW